jgi:hypothetical protein
MTAALTNWNWPGSRWWKFDFHTHTPASHDTPWHVSPATEPAPSPEQWLLRYMAAGIDCVAITDHNSAAWIDLLKEANHRLRNSEPKPSGYRDLTIFPGVEISVCGGLHALVLFDPSTPASAITSLLGAVGFPAQLHGATDGADTAACTRASFVEVISKVSEHNGIVIPAHADKAKGLLLQSNPDALRHALEYGIDAIEITNPASPKPDIYRTRSPGWAEVVGSDCHSFHGSAVPGSWFTWVKMASPTIDGLRLALHDGNGVSIRRHDGPDAASFDPCAVPPLALTSLTIANFQVMGNGQPLTLRFNPFFNAVIGGRGTGKSTAVHALRLLFRRVDDLKKLPKGSSALQTFERFDNVPAARNDRNGGGLRANSSIQAELVRDEIHYRLTWNKAGTGQAVEEWDGTTWKPSASQTIDGRRFGIRLFSHRARQTVPQALLKPR